MQREVSSKNFFEKIKAKSISTRKIFDEEAIKELAESIKEHGILQPIIVRKKGEI